MKKRILSVLMATVLTFAATACGKKGDTEQEDLNAVNVTVSQAKIDNVERRLSYNGEVLAGDMASITAKVSAKVEDILIEDGEYVEAGTTLATLDATDIRLSYNQALANYNSAKASFDMTSNASVKQAETAASQQLKRAEIEYNDAKQNAERMRSLYEMGALSKVEYDAAKIRLDNAELNYTSAKENLDLQTGVTSEKTIMSASAAVQAAKATLDIAENNLKNTSIVAPISGFVSSRNLVKGQMVSPGIEIFSIKNTGSVDVKINVTETDIPYIKVGTPAQISVKSASIGPVEGAVSAAEQAKNDQTGLFGVKISIPNEDGKIKAGMFADINLVLEISENAVAIPSEAIMQKGEEFYVFVASKDGKTAEKKVVIKGIENTEMTEILSGIDEGEKVILKGKEYLSEKNNKIRITD